MPAAKEINEKPLLEFAAKHGGIGCYLNEETHTGYPRNIGEAAKGFPIKVIRAKLAALIRRGLMTGCTCGCRGDYDITDKGRQYLSNI